MIITIGTYSMSTRLLIYPTLAYVDDTIAHTLPVTYQEVVSHALVAIVQVLAANRFSITRWLANMVDHDALPVWY